MIYAVWLEDIESDKRKTNLQHDIAWKLFEHALKKEYDIALSECTIEKNRWGKPGLREHPDIYFSISHCKSIAVCTLSSLEIGIDAETVGRDCKDNVIRRILADDEYEHVMSIADKALRVREFIRYWTLKESYGKAIGKGLSYDYKAVSFLPCYAEIRDIDGYKLKSLGNCNIQKTISQDVQKVSVTGDIQEYKFWQTIVTQDKAEIIITVCRRQKDDFIESIEWVNKSDL